MNKRQFFYTISVVIFFWLLLFPNWQCDKPAAPEGPAFILQNQQILVPNIISNYVSSARFAADGRTVIFNGRLDGDSWDCIYTIPAKGGKYRKVIESTDDLFFPSFSDDGSKIIYTKGFARQIMLYDIASGESSELPIFGNTPILLPDNETVLYSGVIDANLKLYHLPTRQTKNLTESYISANFAPVMLSDGSQLHWIEKLRNGLYKLNRAALDSTAPAAFYSCRKPVFGIATSPGGKWVMVNYQDGSLMAVNAEDSSTATVEIQVDDNDRQLTPLISLPDWSVDGSKLIYASVLPEKYATVNPFFKHGYYKADLVIADLKWDKISAEDIVHPLPRQQLTLFSKPLSDSVATLFHQKTNNPPKIVSNPPTTVLQGDVYIYRAHAVDIDLFDELEYRQTGGPAGAEMLPRSGILYWVAGEPGNYRFTVLVSDNKGAEDKQTFTVNVLPRPDWKKSNFIPQPKPEIQSEYMAGLVFKDPNNDGFLSAGENAGLLIDLRTRNVAMDSVKLQLLTTTSSGEIEMEQELIFERCVPERWTRKIIPIKGLEGLRNRPIVIRGILQNSKGISLLPASLVISGRNTGTQ